MNYYIKTVEYLKQHDGARNIAVGTGFNVAFGIGSTPITQVPYGLKIDKQIAGLKIPYITLAKRKIAQRGGHITSLWYPLGAACVKSGAKQGIKGSALVGADNSNLPFLVKIGWSAFVISGFLTPLDRLATVARHYADLSFLNVARQVASGGITNLYKGFFTDLPKNWVDALIILGSNEALKSYAQYKGTDSSQQKVFDVSLFTVTALVTYLKVIITNPFDVTKTIVQSYLKDQNVQLSESLKAQAPKNIYDVYRQKGLLHLVFAGTLARCIMNGSGSLISLASLRLNAALKAELGVPSEPKNKIKRLA